MLLLAGQFAGWILITLWAEALSAWVSIPLLALLLTLHSSLQHEALHGHPTRHSRINEALVFLPFGLFIPYRRFRDEHLLHHYDPNLTDPYDDPESNYLHPQDWVCLPRWMQHVLRFNNTLLGRMLIGPAISLYRLYATDARSIARKPSVRRAYLLHFLGLICVYAWLLNVATIPLGHYLIGSYLALSILKIRTFLEHQAHERSCSRSVIITDRGLLAFLFLNNNYHLVHHANPTLAWHQLPKAFAAKRDSYLARNEGYLFTNYREVMQKHLLRSKDPVAHPLRHDRRNHTRML